MQNVNYKSTKNNNEGMLIEAQTSISQKNHINLAEPKAPQNKVQKTNFNDKSSFISEYNKCLSVFFGKTSR